MRQWGRHSGALGGALLVGVLAALLLARPPGATLRLSVGALDRRLQSGFHLAEISAEDRLFRWTNGDSTLSLPVQGLGPHVLTLLLAAPRASERPVEITVNDAPLATLTLQGVPRRYTLLVPAAMAGWPQSRVTIKSETFTTPGDSRRLGVVLHGAEYSASAPQGWLPPLQIAALLLACLLLGAALRALGAASPAAVLLFAAISLAMGLSETRFVPRASATLLTLGLAGVFGLALLAARWRGDVALQIAEPEPRGSFSGRQMAALIALFAALSLVPLAPVLPDPARFLLGQPGDNFEYAWKMHWFVDSLIGKRRSALFQPDFFYPAGFDVARSELTPAHTLLGLPLTLLLGPVASYNLTLYASYVATGVLTALLAARLGAGRVGALAAGVGVAFCTYRYVYSLGSLPLAGTQWVILAFYGWEGFVQRQRPRDALLAGLGAALGAWASWYYGPTLLIMLAVYTALRCTRAEALALMRAWRAALVAPLVALALVAPYAQPYIALGAPPHARDELAQLAASPLGYLLPGSFNALWASWAQQLANALGVTQRVSVGWGVLALALAGLWRWRRRRTVRALLGMALVAFVLSLGLELRVGALAIPLPVELIYEHVPGLRNIRVWSRLSFFVQISAALLAGLALTGFATWGARRRVGAVLLLGLVLVESINAPPQVSDSAPRPVDAWLAAQPDARPIAQAPDFVSGYSEFYTIYNRRRLTVGYGTFYPEFFLIEYPALQRFPAPEAVEALRRLGTGYLLVRHDLMDTQRPGWRAAVAALPDLRLVYDDGAIAVYRVRLPGEPAAGGE